MLIGEDRAKDSPPCLRRPNRSSEMLPSRSLMSIKTNPSVRSMASKAFHDLYFLMAETMFSITEELLAMKIHLPKQLKDFVSRSIAVNCHIF